VQRLGNILITGALPSTSGAALNTIAGTIPIDLMIEEGAAKGGLRLMANNHWINEPMLNPGDVSPKIVSLLCRYPTHSYTFEGP
jgi:hypothetical protein